MGGAAAAVAAAGELRFYCHGQHHQMEAKPPQPRCQMARESLDMDWETLASAPDGAVYQNLGPKATHEMQDAAKLEWAAYDQEYATWAAKQEHLSELSGGSGCKEDGDDPPPEHMEEGLARTSSWHAASGDNNQYTIDEETAPVIPANAGWSCRRCTVENEFGASACGVGDLTRMESEAYVEGQSGQGGDSEQADGGLAREDRERGRPVEVPLEESSEHCRCCPDSCCFRGDEGNGGEVEEERSMLEICCGTRKRCVATNCSLLVLIVASVVMSMCVASLEPTEYGILMNGFTGTVDETVTYSGGLHMIMINHHFIKFPATLFLKDYSINPKSSYPAVKCRA